MNVHAGSSKETAPAAGSDDPIWRIAFPIFYFLVVGYGLTASVTYDIILSAPRGSHLLTAPGFAPPTQSQVDGAYLLIASGLVALLGTLARWRLGGRGERLRHLGDMFAMSGTVVLILAMGLYATFIYLDVLGGAFQRLPSVLFPLVIGWFPVVALVALVRTTRRQSSARTALARLDEDEAAGR